jgi:hypothetical protein
MGWHLFDVVGISNDGRTVAGNGTNPDGNAEAWIVRLDHPIGAPEPSSLASALLAGIPFVMARRRRKLFVRDAMAFQSSRHET